ncbi:unnamed protein product [Symbiodinium natans]|uniref:Uncharacterized protein n=1 Tax=Symbiodinium natans TaxID=878477 RepID=A0A812JHE9_9DINO|nr:unnamed protein product [Symbiodinium natans]
MAKHTLGARSLVCLAVLFYQVGLLAKWDFIGLTSRLSVRADPPRRTLQATGGSQAKVLEKELQEELEQEPKDVKDVKEESMSRAAQKTAETKERVAEKKRRMESDAKGSKGGEEEPMFDMFDAIDWAGYAKQAREMAAEAGKEAAKPGEASAAARAQELAWGFAASGLDAAAEAPVLVPVAGATLLLLLTFSLTFGRPAETPRPVQRPQAAPVLVAQTEAPAAPKRPVTASTPVAPVAPVAPAPAAATKQDLPWARNLAKSARDTLKTVADELPAAVPIVEEGLPKAESAFNWVSTLTPENAPEKIEKDALPAAAQLAGDVLRAGLRVGATGLDFASQNLPAAEEALGKAVEKGLPVAQSALRDAANGVRTLAKEGLPVQPDESNSVVRALVSAAPDVLSSTAKALDATADAAPQVTAVVGQAVTQVTPIAQATLGVASDLVEGASNIPGSAVEQAAGKLADTVKATLPDAASNAKQLVEAASTAMTKK